MGPLGGSLEGFKGFYCLMAWAMDETDHGSSGSSGGKSSISLKQHQNHIKTLTIRDENRRKYWR
jgi:hypothetical protein